MKLKANIIHYWQWSHCCKHPFPSPSEKSLKTWLGFSRDLGCVSRRQEQGPCARHSAPLALCTHLPPDAGSVESTVWRGKRLESIPSLVTSGLSNLVSYLTSLRLSCLPCKMGTKYLSFLIRLLWGLNNIKCLLSPGSDVVTTLQMEGTRRSTSG